MILELKNVKKIYGSRTVLDLENLMFKGATNYAVIGPNGSGKSTLLKLIAGIIDPDDGVILHKNRDNCTNNGTKYIAWLPQKPYLFDMTVIDNIRSGIRERKESITIVEKAIEFAGLGSIAGLNARKISGGEAQKTAVLRTLVLGSELVLLDEPATSIDISNMERIEDCIRTIRKENSTVILTTHDPAQALRMAETVIVLINGRLVEIGPAKEVLRSPRNEETKAFLENWRT
jgi:ABC-type cobalamin/Fe3+-siderophores transport systems, ATPase components